MYKICIDYKRECMKCKAEQTPFHIERKSALALTMKLVINWVKIKEKEMQSFRNRKNKQYKLLTGSFLLSPLSLYKPKPELGSKK